MPPINWPAVTDRVILAVVVLLILYNVAAGVVGGGEATISGRIQHHATRFPVLPLLVGALAAHWFWPVFGIRQ